MKKILDNKPRLFFWIGIVFITMLVGLGLFMGQLSEDADDKVLAIVGGERITQRDLNREIFGINFKGTIASPVDIPEEQRKVLLEELIDEKIYLIKAKELGITLDQIEIDQYLEKERGSKNLDGFNEDEKETILTATRRILTKEKVNQRVISSRKGEYVEIRFDKYFSAGGSRTDGTEQQKSEIRVYAEKLANEIYNKLKSGVIDFNEATKIVDNDPVIDIENYFGTWGSQGGEIVNFIQYENDPILFKKIEAMAEGEISKPLVRSIPLEEDPSRSRESTFIIFRINELKKGEAASENAWLEKQRELLTIEYRGRV